MGPVKVGIVHYHHYKVSSCIPEPAVGFYFSILKSMFNNRRINKHCITNKTKDQYGHNGITYLTGIIAAGRKCLLYLFILPFFSEKYVEQYGGDQSQYKVAAADGFDDIIIYLPVHILSYNIPT